jgi:hypothetical protein
LSCNFARWAILTPSAHAADDEEDAHEHEAERVTGLPKMAVATRTAAMPIRPSSR